MFSQSVFPGRFVGLQEVEETCFQVGCARLVVDLSTPPLCMFVGYIVLVI